MADDRKARLAALAARAGRAKATNPEEDNIEQLQTEENDDASSQQKKTISFRNYAPTNKSLEHQSSSDQDGNEEERQRQQQQHPANKRPRITDDEEAADTVTAPPTSQSMLQDALREAQKEGPSPVDGVVTAAGASSTTVVAVPKKINWDLKRDIAPKLAKLERRTQKVIVEMLKQRLEIEASQAADDDDDDDDLD